MKTRDLMKGFGVAVSTAALVVSLGAGAVLAGEVTGSGKMLRVAKRPNLIYLDALAVQIAHDSALVHRACRAEVYEQLGNGVDAAPGHARYRAERIALYEHPEDFGAVFYRQAVHCLWLLKLNYMPEETTCQLVFTGIRNYLPPNSCVQLRQRTILDPDALWQSGDDHGRSAESGSERDACRGI